MNRGARRHVWISLVLAAAGATAGACGDNLAPVLPDGPPAPPDAMVWNAAPHAGAPQIVPSGGPVQTAPVVVPVFVKGDDLIEGEAETFLGHLAASPYWSAATGEYGVGALTVKPSIVLDAAPASDADFAALIASNADGSHAGWPRADVNTTYTLFLPVGATLSDSPGACTQYGGYHTEGMFADGTPTVYAIIPRCAVDGSYLFSLTVATSHELIEAATDPLPYSKPAFAQPDADHVIWGRHPQGELGDMCEYVTAANQYLIGNYNAQRSWSNAAAAAGHDPCVPAPATPYLAAAPVLDDTVMMKQRNATIPTRGVTIPVGMSKTIEVDLFSDGPSADFSVYAQDVPSWLDGRPVELTFAWDKQTGHNGDKLMLTITHKVAGRGGGSEFAIFVGKAGATTAQWWGVVGN